MDDVILRCGQTVISYNVDRREKICGRRKKERHLNEKKRNRKEKKYDVKLL